MECIYYSPWLFQFITYIRAHTERPTSSVATDVQCVRADGQIGQEKDQERGTPYPASYELGCLLNDPDWVHVPVYHREEM